MDKHFESLIKPRLDTIRPRVLLEIGVCQGATTLPLLRWCRENDARLVSLDPVAWCGNLPHDIKSPYQNYVFKYGGETAMPTIAAPYLEQAYTEGLFEYWECKKTTSIDFLRQKSGAYDAVFIDGDHNYYTVYNELSLIAPMLNEGGIIFLHDVADRWGRTDQYYDIRSIPPEYVNGSKQGVLTAIDAFLDDVGGVKRGALANAELLYCWYAAHPANGVLARLKGAARIMLRGYDNVWTLREHMAFQYANEESIVEEKGHSYEFEILSARHFGLGLITKGRTSRHG